MASLLTLLRDYMTDHDLWHKNLELKRGDHLHFAGDLDTNMYFVESGTLRYYILLDEEPEEQVIRFGYQGNFTAAIDCFMNNEPTIFYAQALRKCRLKMIKRERFYHQLQVDEELVSMWQEVMRWIIGGQLEREIDLLTSSPEVRYQRVLARSPQLFQEIPAKYIANYLRMTPETLSRIGARS
ncbi:MAG: Crp/Fnr family transcriptional regulator [Bacteroidota bacterium]